MKLLTDIDNLIVEAASTNANFNSGNWGAYTPAPSNNDWTGRTFTNPYSPSGAQYSAPVSTSDKFKYAGKGLMIGTGVLGIYSIKDIIYNFLSDISGKVSNFIDRHTPPEIWTSKINNIKTELDNANANIKSSENRLEVLNDAISNKQKILDNIIEQQHDNEIGIFWMFQTLLTATLGISFLANSKRKDRIKLFDIELSSFKRILNANGFNKINQIFETALQLRDQQIKTCKQPDMNLIEKIIEKFTMQLNCLHISIIQYAIFIISQSYVLYFSNAKQKNPNIKVNSISDILIYDFDNCKIFRKKLVDLTESFYRILDIVYDKQPGNIATKEQLEKQTLSAINR